MEMHPPQVRDKKGEFLKGHPPVFKHSTDPLQADDWLHAIEWQLEIAQCDDREKVLYAYDSCKWLHLTGGTLSVLAAPKLIPSLGKNFAVPSALIMCLLD